MLLITGGAGFIGANFVLDWLAGCSEPVLNVDKLSYAGNLDTLRSLHNDPRHVFVHADINDREPLIRPASPARRASLRSGNACGSLNSQAGGFCSDQCRRHFYAARSRARVLESINGRVQSPIPLCAYFDRGSVRRAGAGCAAVYGKHGLRAEQSLFGVQGGVRPLCARLSPYLWIARTYNPLLKQLRLVSISRKNDPADADPRAGWKTAARLRRWPAHP